MNINFGNKLKYYRKEKNITQEDLAKYLNITKSSISKWESNKSTPELVYIIKIALYFNITIDELLDYKKYYTNEEINEICKDYKDKINKNNFLFIYYDILDNINKYKYDNNFVIEMIIIILNYYNIIDDNKKKINILEELNTLCDSIIKDNTDIIITNKASHLKYFINYLLNNYDFIISNLKPIVESNNIILNYDSLLILTYLKNNNINEAKYYIQLSLFNYLNNFISTNVYLLKICDNENNCNDIIKKINTIIEMYKFEDINTNLVLNYYYQVLEKYCYYKYIDNALNLLEIMVNLFINFYNNNFKFNNNNYFDRLNGYFNKIINQNNIPINKEDIYNNFLLSFNNDKFKILFKYEKYQNIIYKLKCFKED